jgi:hypothetical protein
MGYRFAVLECFYMTKISQPGSSQVEPLLAWAGTQDVNNLGKAVIAIATKSSAGKSENPIKQPDTDVFSPSLHLKDMRVNMMVKGLNATQATDTFSQHDGLGKDTPANVWQTWWVKKPALSKPPAHKVAGNAVKQTADKPALKSAGVITHATVTDENGRQKMLIALAKPFKPGQFKHVGRGLAQLLAKTVTEKADIKDVLILADAQDQGLHQWMNQLSQLKGVHTHEYGQTAINGVPQKWQHLVSQLDPNHKNTLYMFHTQALYKPFEGLSLSLKDKRHAIENRLSRLVESKKTR